MCLYIPIIETLHTMNRKKLLILVCILLNGFVSFSQSDASFASSQTEFYQLQSELNGKFQTQMIGTRAKPVIPQDLLVEIKNRQKQSERVYFDYKPNIRIMILSKDEVSNGISISEEESIIYIN